MTDPVKPKRAPRASKRAGVAVPFAAGIETGIDTGSADSVNADQPIAEVIEAIAHLPIDEPAAPTPADKATASPPIDQTKTAAATAPTSQEDDTMTDTMQNTAETMQANAQDAMGKGKQAFEDMTAFGQGNVEAMVESTRVAFKGMEAMTQARAAFAKQSFDATVQTLKSMAEVRSPADLFKLQGEYLRNSMDALVAETSRSTEATLKLVGEIAQPIQNRVALAAEKVRSAA
ncbi:phasin family protein [uncultured Sphingomonas sp.]|uniref:phasin family protein n=1 Tax=uncultured Sphingomonas sp. TaxID=158754 RepID=UPI002615575B|nr:phasin family protein [uncultured Sphingomonas sp.]